MANQPPFLPDNAEREGPYDPIPRGASYGGKVYTGYDDWDPEPEYYDKQGLKRKEVPYTPPIFGGKREPPRKYTTKTFGTPTFKPSVAEQQPEPWMNKANYSDFTQTGKEKAQSLHFRHIYKNSQERNAEAETKVFIGKAEYRAKFVPGTNATQVLLQASGKPAWFDREDDEGVEEGDEDSYTTGPTGEEVYHPADSSELFGSNPLLATPDGFLEVTPGPKAKSQEWFYAGKDISQQLGLRLRVNQPANFSEFAQNGKFIAEKEGMILKYIDGKELSVEERKEWDSIKAAVSTPIDNLPPPQRKLLEGYLSDEPTKKPFADEEDPDMFPGFIGLNAIQILEGSPNAMDSYLDLFLRPNSKFRGLLSYKPPYLAFEY